MKKLIVNADDFGFTKAITDAIIDCHSNGIVTSTTLMSNMPFAEYAASKAKDFPELSVGLHLNLTEGKPLAAPDKIDRLVDSEGNFLDKSNQFKNLRSNKKVKEQVYKEFEAQLLRALDLGVNISHCTGHRRIEKKLVVRKAIKKLYKRYGVFAVRTRKRLYWTDPKANFYFKLKKTLLNLRRFPSVYARIFNHLIAKKTGLPLPDRMISPRYLIPCHFDPKEQFIRCFNSLPEGVSELLLHPGYYDEKSMESPAFRKTREFDTQIACDKDIKNCIKECNIELISFRDLLNNSEKPPHLLS
ncbi:MAG: ChbG/HpnK family deacetylase [Sedimentisphaerales bacterium]